MSSMMSASGNASLTEAGFPLMGVEGTTGGVEVLVGTVVSLASLVVTVL